MSWPDDMNALVAELLNADTESWARLLGLMSQLALPVRSAIEVEISPDIWQVVDALSLEGGQIICSAGRGAERQEYRFTRTEGVPRWRCAGREQ